MHFSWSCQAHGNEVEHIKRELVLILEQPLYISIFLYIVLFILA